MIIAEDFRRIVADALELEPALLQPETNLYELPNFDSVAILSLIVALDDVGVEIPQEKASEIRTYGDLLELAKLQ